MSENLHAKHRERMRKRFASTDSDGFFVAFFRKKSRISGSIAKKCAIDLFVLLYSVSIASKASSSKTGMPSDCALVSLEPASSPANT